MSADSEDANGRDGQCADRERRGFDTGRTSLQYDGSFAGIELYRDS